MPNSMPNSNTNTNTNSNTNSISNTNSNTHSFSYFNIVIHIDIAHDLWVWAMPMAIGIKFNDLFIY